MGGNRAVTVRTLARSCLRADTPAMRPSSLAGFAVVAVFTLVSGASLAQEPESSGRTYHDVSADGTLLPPRGERGVAAAAVLGSDERTRIIDTTAYPFSSVAFLELEDDQGNVFGACTGTLIGPDALLTAGHCLWDIEAGDWGAARIRVVPAKDGDFEPFGSQYAEDWWVPDAYAESGLDVFDWGLINLAGDDLTENTGWLSISVLEDAQLLAPEFFPAIVGYPGDKPRGTMWGHVTDRFLSVGAFTLAYGIDTAPGQSGAAVWSAAEGPYLGLVVGIHTFGGLVNEGQRIDQELVDDLVSGCEAMSCSISVHSVALPPPTPEPEPPDPVLRFRSEGVAVARD